jgi:hypothetical protein
VGFTHSGDEAPLVKKRKKKRKEKREINARLVNIAVSKRKRKTIVQTTSATTSTPRVSNLSSDEWLT